MGSIAKIKKVFIAKIALIGLYALRSNINHFSTGWQQSDKKRIDAINDLIIMLGGR